MRMRDREDSESGKNTKGFVCEVSLLALAIASTGSSCNFAGACVRKVGPEPLAHLRRLMHPTIVCSLVSAFHSPFCLLERGDPYVHRS
jgi:hypothetical protein